MKGSSFSGEHRNVEVTPDFISQTTDIRFIGWVVLALFLLLSSVVIIKHNRWDVAGQIFSPFFLVPFILILKFGRKSYENRVFRLINGYPAFAIPEESWNSEITKDFLRTKLGEQNAPSDGDKHPV